MPKRGYGLCAGRTACKNGEMTVHNERDAGEARPRHSAGTASAHLNAESNPQWGGSTWQADVELGEKRHRLVGYYRAQIATSGTADRRDLLAKLVTELYDIDAAMRVQLVRRRRDVTAFDNEHVLRSELAVRSMLRDRSTGTVWIQDEEEELIQQLLAARRSHWLSEALRRAKSPPGSTADSQGSSYSAVAAAAVIPVTEEAIALPSMVTDPDNQGNPCELTWAGVRICFTSDHRVQIFVRDKRRR